MPTFPSGPPLALLSCHCLEFTYFVKRKPRGKEPELIHVQVPLFGSGQRWAMCHCGASLLKTWAGNEPDAGLSSGLASTVPGSKPGHSTAWRQMRKLKAGETRQLAQDHAFNKHQTYCIFIFWFCCRGDYSHMKRLGNFFLFICFLKEFVLDLCRFDRTY